MFFSFGSYYYFHIRKLFGKLIHTIPKSPDWDFFFLVASEWVLTDRLVTSRQCGIQVFLEPYSKLMFCIKSHIWLKAQVPLCHLCPLVVSSSPLLLQSLRIEASHWQLLLLVHRLLLRSSFQAITSFLLIMLLAPILPPTFHQHPLSWNFTVPPTKGAAICPCHLSLNLPCTARPIV